MIDLRKEAVRREILSKVLKPTRFAPTSRTIPSQSHALERINAKDMGKTVAKRLRAGDVTGAERAKSIGKELRQVSRDELKSPHLKNKHRRLPG